MNTSNEPSPANAKRTSRFSLPVLKRTLAYGTLSGILYYLLYHYNETILEYSRQGEWYFILPVSIAFIFSIVHGNFTGQFWDLFGIKAKTTKK